MKIKTYNKQNEFEKFKVGDLVSFIPNTSLVTKSITRHYKHQDKLVVGVCIADNKDTVDVVNEGIVDVNVTGIICIGDRLTTSSISGKARAIKNDNDEIRVFNIRPIGKVVGLYNDYSVAKVLLGIE